MPRYLAFVVVLLLGSAAFAQQQQQPKGLPARSNPGDYKAHVTVANTTYAASVVSPDQLKHVFAFDISKDYVVLEVAIYPQPGSAIDLDPDGFLVRSPQTADPVRPADSITVASVIQQKNVPEPSRVGPVVASAEVGYESGRDPYTGRPVHGTYTAAQVGVGVDDRRMPPGPPSPGGYPQDRALLEQQLWEKSFPAGHITQPTAGYLYFPISLLKKVKGQYNVEYIGSGQQPVLSGAHSSPHAVQLQVPVKSR